MKNSISVRKSLLFPRNSVTRGFNSIPVYALVNNTAEQCRKMYQSTWCVPNPSKKIDWEPGSVDYVETFALHDEGELALVCCFQRIRDNKVQRFLSEPSPSAELTQLLQLHYMRRFPCLSEIEKNKSTLSSTKMLVYETPEFIQEDVCVGNLFDQNQLTVEIVENGKVKFLPPLTTNMINYFEFKLTQIASSWDEAKMFDKVNPPTKMLEKWKQYVIDFNIGAEAGS